MKNIAIVALATALLIPAIPANANGDRISDPRCFIELQGRIINLNNLCGGFSPRFDISSPSFINSPVVRIASPSVAQSPQSPRCPAGFKVTIAGACRSLATPLLNLSDFRVAKTSNPFLFSLTYTVTNSIEVPVNLQFAYLQITTNGLTKSKLIQPSVTLQPNQSLRLNATLLDDDLAGGSPEQASVTLDRIIAVER